MKKFNFKRSVEAEEFFCSRCKKTKKSKNTATEDGGKDKLCNGCYGLLLSRKEITR